MKAISYNVTNSEIQTLDSNEAQILFAQFLAERQDVQLDLGDRWVRLFSHHANDGVSFHNDDSSAYRSLFAYAQAFGEQFGMPLEEPLKGSFLMDAIKVQTYLIDFDWPEKDATASDTIRAAHGPVSILPETEEVDSDWPSDIKPAARKPLASIPAMTADMDQAWDPNPALSVAV